MEKVVVGTGPLSPQEVVAVARHGAAVQLSAQATDEIVANACHHR